MEPSPSAVPTSAASGSDGAPPIRQNTRISNRPMPKSGRDRHSQPEAEPSFNSCATQSKPPSAPAPLTNPFQRPSEAQVQPTAPLAPAKAGLPRYVQQPQQEPSPTQTMTQMP